MPKHRQILHWGHFRDFLGPNWPIRTFFKNQAPSFFLTLWLSNFKQTIKNWSAISEILLDKWINRKGADGQIEEETQTHRPLLLPKQGLNYKVIHKCSPQRSLKIHFPTGLKWPLRRLKCMSLYVTWLRNHEVLQFASLTFK